MRARILYGGSFDPPTLGHRAVLEIARRAFPGAEIVVVPAGWQPQKDPDRVRPAELRLEMARLAFGDLPGLRVSDEECLRPGRSYTVDTLRAQAEGLRALPPDQRPQLYLLMGSDSTLSLPGWREPRQILQLARVLTVPRPGFDPKAIQELPGLTHKEKEDLLQGVLPEEAPPISSTEVRARLQAGKSVEGLVAPQVLAFIQKEGLYRPRS
ncbi:MAG TPA: nicotinate (nicotinamide) nucleotide adenylyltransferase [Planctomycetes bacterium]|nr:nicotinate (nicotinamide) nucleotide adenylyltransferase [Planctomycetota bacterium]